jgi:hypothetical protein
MCVQRRLQLDVRHARADDYADRAELSAFSSADRGVSGVEVTGLISQRLR